MPTIQLKRGQSSFQHLVKTLLWRERSQLILWLPVLFGLGIAVYFSLNQEPEIRNPMALSALLGTAALLARRSRVAVALLVMAVMISGGFAVASFRAHQVQAPVIADEWKKSYQIMGEVEAIEKRTRGYRVWLTQLKLKQIEPQWTPARIRISVNTDMSGVRVGDYVELKAILYPPPLPAMPGAYDFARQAYFEKIGAVGYSVSAFSVKSRSTELRFMAWIEGLRTTLAERIRQGASADEEGAIAAALLIGDRGAINSGVVDQMRNAGLAHLLAISGLHLALVAMICFFTVRMALACSSYLALKHPIKQYAALCAIFFSFMYLLITGAPISAERAFIMTGLVLLAILLNRSVTPMRSIALAAFLVLLFTPESILSPSFQMSFAAAGALIAAFEYARKYMAVLLEDAGMIRRISVYFVGVLLSSFVAGAATAPFALYHFSHMSSYSLLANLVAVPLTSLWIMPWGMVVFLLLPFGMESLALYPMGMGIDIVLKVAEYISSLPNANPAVKALPMSSLVLVTIAMLWLLLWKTRIRIYGLILLIPAMWITLSQPIADILVHEDGRMLAFRNDEGLYEFPAKTSPRFVRASWLERLGQRDFIKLKDGESSQNLQNEGDRNYIYSKDGLNILFAHDKDYAKLRCGEADYFVDMFWYEVMRCDGVETLFNRQDLDLNGSYIVYLEEEEIPKIEHVRGYRGDRLW